MDAEQLAQLKLIATRARDSFTHWGREWERDATPSAVLDLIAEVERLREDLRILTKGRFIQS